MDTSLQSEKGLLNWLLEPVNPSVRYFTLTKILDKIVNDQEVKQARADIMNSEPVKGILALQNKGGWWDNHEHATMPMYLSTAWQLMLLAELGASWEDKRVYEGVDFVFENAQDKQGAFPHEGTRWQKKSPMDLICNDGLIAFGLIGVGVPYSDERMCHTVDFFADVLRSGEYECRFNKDAICAWGVVKALRVLSRVPQTERTQSVKKAIDRAAEFILSRNLAKADYPTKPGGKVSPHWFLLGFPRSYQADILQTALILTELGYSKDARFKPVEDFLLSKRLPDGAWPLEATWNKLSVPFVKKSKRNPSKWITWQVLYILKRIGVSIS